MRSSTFWPCVKPIIVRDGLEHWFLALKFVNLIHEDGASPYFVFAENIFFNNNFCNLNLSVNIHSFTIFSLLIQHKAIFNLKFKVSMRHPVRTSLSSVKAPSVVKNEGRNCHSHRTSWVIIYFSAWGNSNTIKSQRKKMRPLPKSGQNPSFI